MEREKLQKFSDNRADLGMIGVGVITAESGNFCFNLGSGKYGVYHEIKAIGIKNVTTKFGEYGLEELEKEFMSSTTESEKEYVLLKTVGGSRVHLLLGVKNTRIQPVLLWVLSSGVGMYLSLFKDVWGSRIIFAGPSKFFTQANKEQQRELIHAVYSASKNFPESNNIGELRSESTSKVKISHHINNIQRSQKSVPVSSDLISSASSAELARVTVSTDDCKQISGNNCIFRLGSGTTIDKFQDLLMIFILCVFTFFKQLQSGSV